MKKIKILILITILTGCANVHTKEEQEGILAPMGKKGELTVSTAYYDKTLYNAAELFKTKFKGWTVDIAEYAELTKEWSLAYDVYNNAVAVRVDTPDPMGDEKYQTVINSAIMSGLGPDIISMDRLSAIYLMRANILEDLNPYFEADSKIKNIRFTSFLNTAELNGKLYYMPVRAGVDLMTVLAYGDEFRDIMYVWESVPKKWTWEEAAAYFIPVIENEEYDFTCLFGMTPQELTVEASKNYFQYLVDEETCTCNFTGEVFIETLRSIKSLYDQGLLYNAEGEITSIEAPRPLLDIRPVNPSLIRDYETLDFGQYYVFPVVSGVFGNALNIGKVYAINSNSKQKAAAWEYIKTLTSDKVQYNGYPSPNYSSVNAYIYSLECEGMFRSVLINRYPDNPELQVPSKFPEELGRLKRERTVFMQSAIRIRLPDTGEFTDIFSLLIERHTKDYFTGKASLEETAATVQNAVQRWLDELK